MCGAKHGVGQDRERVKRRAGDQPTIRGSDSESDAPDRYFVAHSHDRASPAEPFVYFGNAG